MHSVSTPIISVNQNYFCSRYTREYRPSFLLSAEIRSLSPPPFYKKSLTSYRLMSRAGWFIWPFCVIRVPLSPLSRCAFVFAGLEATRSFCRPHIVEELAFSSAAYASSTSKLSVRDLFETSTITIYHYMCRIQAHSSKLLVPIKPAQYGTGTQRHGNYMLTLWCRVRSVSKRYHTFLKVQ
jgi:hypothetical protein